MRLETTATFFSLGKECFVVVVWRPVRIRVGVTASHLTLRIPYLDRQYIGNPVELPLKSDFIRNEALPGNSCVCCVRCWRSPGRAHSHCPFVYFPSLYERLLKERRQHSRLFETRLSRCIRKTISSLRCSASVLNRLFSLSIVFF